MPMSRVFIARLLTNVDVDWEISQRKDEYRDCNITKTVTETVTYTDSEGNQQTDTYEYEQTDWDACHALEYGTDEYNAAWSIRASFDNCNERLQYDYDQRAEQIARDKARAEEEGREYDGPETPYDDPGWMGDAYTNTYINSDNETITEEIPANRWGHRGQMERCKAIGPLPTSIINGGNASVVNGEIVFDPTPSS